MILSAIVLPSSPGAPRPYPLTTYAEWPSLDGPATSVSGSCSWGLPTRWCLCNPMSSALLYSVSFGLLLAVLKAHVGEILWNHENMPRLVVGQYGHAL
jgi:hypothetical protein